MKIKQRLNNNVLVVYDDCEPHKEKIVIGKGLGFQANIHDVVPAAKIEKVFVIEDKTLSTKFKQILASIPDEHIWLTERIISHAEKILNTTLNIHIHVSLADHLTFAVERIKGGLLIKNKLLNEIRILYSEEYNIGLWAIALIKDALKIDMPEDEAGYIALHLHVAKVNRQDMTATMHLATTINEMVELIEQELHLTLEHQTVAYHRLVTHLQFALQRLISGEALPAIDPDISQTVQLKYAQEFICAQKLKAYLRKAYGYNMPEGELVYLAMHLKVTSSKQPPK